MESNKVADRLSPLPAGSLEWRGWLGQALHGSLERRLKRIRYGHLVDPFRWRNENDGRWRCEFWGKIVRSAVQTWRALPDPELRQLIQDTVADLLTTQRPDGSISSYPEERQTRDWDIWGRKYVMLGLLRYYREISPEPAVRRGLVRLADHLLSQVGPGHEDILHCGWHDGMAASSILEPMVLLHRLTGDRRYEDFARWIIARGGSARGDIFAGARAGRLPKELGNGKAYEMMSCFEGVAELYRTTGEAQLLQTVQALVTAIRQREIFVTGVGGLKDEVGEFWDDGRFRQALPGGTGGLGETCVTTTWVKLCTQLLRLTGDPSLADDLECSLYNGVLGAMRPDGGWWAHLNPTPLTGPASKIPAPDQLPGYGEDCCLAQGPKALAMAPYIAVMRHAAGVTVNLYNDCQARFSLPDGQPAVLHLSGGFPRYGEVTIRLQLPPGAHRFLLQLRQPAWSRQTALSLNGAPLPVARPGTYLDLERPWQNGDTLRLHLDLSLQKIADPGGSARIALRRGPLILAQDSRLGEVGAAVDARGGAMITTPPGFHLVCRLADGSSLCDYASAGGLFSPDNTLAVWLPERN